MNIEDINIGDVLWHSNQGGIGQFRVTDIDKDNNTFDYKSSDNKSHKLKLDNNFYTNPQDAFTAAQRYNNLWMKGVKQGAFGSEVQYNTPQDVDDKQVKQMLLD